MPYKVEHDPQSCPTTKPFAVKKVGGGVVPGGCHAKKVDAQDHSDAMNANVPDTKNVKSVITKLSKQNRS